MTNTILEDYVTFAEAAAQPRMPSLRTLYRWAAQRKIPVTYLGRTPMIHVPSFREVLRARGITVVAKRR